jgi:hypothetical protein
MSRFYEDHGEYAVGENGERVPMSDVITDMQKRASRGERIVCGFNGQYRPGEIVSSFGLKLRIVVVLGSRNGQYRYEVEAAD